MNRLFLQSRHLVLLAVLSGWFGTPAILAQELQKQLTERRESFRERAPAELIASQERALEELRTSGIENRVRKVGDSAPDFTLKDHEGKPVLLSSLLSEGPVVLTWYRGGWCPYCNMTLAALTKAVPEISNLGATLVALTPELPDATAESVKELGLDFKILTDVNHGIAEKYGLVFPLNPDTAARYQSKFDLVGRSGEEAAKSLPLPATFVIQTDGTIAYAFADADYTKRAEPKEIIAKLKELRDEAKGSE